VKQNAAAMIALALSMGLSVEPKPRKGTEPNPYRQNKAERKRAKRLARNLRLEFKEKP